MYGDRGAFGGQFGGLDPSLVEQIYNYVQPSPFASSAMRDPSLLGQTSEMMTRLAYPNDKLAPPTQVDVSMPTGQPEHDALDVIGAIFKAPFRLIGAAKNGLEEAIGHPNADRRAMQDDYAQMMERVALSSKALTDEQKRILFPQWYAQDREAMALAQTGGDATATGRNTSDYPLPTPRKPGIIEWIMGDAQKENARRIAAIRAAEGAMSMNMEGQKLLTERMNTYKTGEEGYAASELGRLRGNQANEVHPTAVAQRGLLAGQTSQAYAGANMNNAGARAHQALADQRNRMTPGMVSEQEAKASKGWADSSNAWTYGPGLSEAEIGVKNANRYKLMSEGDAATAGVQDDLARAGMIRDTAPLRAEVLRTQAGLNTARAGTAESQSGLYDARAAETRDLAPARRGVLEGQMEKLDAQTQATVGFANAGIARIQQQTAGLIQGQGLTQAKMRLMEIQGGVMQSREERAAALDEVKSLLMQTRSEVAMQAQSTRDQLAAKKLQQIDADIARIGSIVDLNRAREAGVGVAGGGAGGGSAFGRALLAQSGRENASDIKTLLTIMNDDFGDVNRTANGLDMLGYVRGQDYDVSEPGFFANKFSGAKAKIIFPEGSRLPGILERYRSEAPARRYLANEGEVPSTQPDTMAGQAPGQVDGETLTLLMNYGYGQLPEKDVMSAIDQAYQDETLNEGQARRAIEFLGAQRKR